METFYAVLFYVLATVTGVSALGVVVTQNIVRAATWLLFALAGAAGIFFLLNAEFIGATQLLIYVGGTLVLVVFGVMLTAQGPFINLRISAAEWVVALGVGLVLFGLLAFSLVQFAPPRPAEHLADASGEPTSEEKKPAAEEKPLPSSRQLGAALLGDLKATPPASLTGIPTGRPIERTPMHYVLPFEVVSVHLLVVLIGAAYLARAKRKRPAGEKV